MIPTMNHFVSRLAPAAALCLPLLAFAQGGGGEPAQARSATPALRYDSAFADYKPWQDIKPGNWRELNDKLAPAPMPMPAPAAPADRASAPAAQAGKHQPMRQDKHQHQHQNMQGGHR